MHIFAVSGLSKTGKTTVIENLIRVFVAQGISVATIKNSDCPFLTIENPNTDTARHREAGAICAALRSPSVSAVLHEGQLDLKCIFGQLNQDLVIMEGFSSVSMPKIVTATYFDNADARYCPQTFAFSGRLAATAATYRELPVIDCFKNARILADIAWEKALQNPEILF